MTIVSTDGKKYIDAGSSDIWQALLSTVSVRLDAGKEEFQPAVRFFSTGTCASKEALETARSVNYLHDALCSFAPEQVVFDANDISKPTPWGGDISPTITSCGNYFTTADGKDLFAELVEILTYAHYIKADVKII